jgi:hypothetical protein
VNTDEGRGKSSILGNEEVLRKLRKCGKAGKDEEQEEFMKA